MALQPENKILESPKNRCRICLEATNGKIELNQTIHYKESGILLRELLEFCLNEQVFENGRADGLCLDCMEKGMVCYEFKKRYEVSQSILLKEFEENNSFEVKIEDDFEEESFIVEADDTAIKNEIFENKEMEQISENPNKCDVCDKIYNSRSAMLRHKRRQHILKIPNPLPTTETDKPTTRSVKKPTTIPPELNQRCPAKQAISNMPLEYVTSTRGNSKLIYDGYLYVKDKLIAGGAVAWKCEQFQSGKCKARVHCKGDEISLMKGEHNHAPDRANIKAKIVVELAKERARSTQETTHQLLTEASMGLTQAVRVKLPAPEHFKRIMRRQRASIVNAASSPKSLRYG